MARKASSGIGMFTFMQYLKTSRQEELYKKIKAIKVFAKQSIKEWAYAISRYKDHGLAREFEAYVIKARRDATVERWRSGSQCIIRRYCASSVNR